jgi:sirohydrochlorin cobaltochelatase
MERALVLVGHGAAAKDTPRAKVGRLRTLEAERRRAPGTPMSEEESALDHEVRHWPRTRDNDPYAAGIEELAAQLRPRVGRLVVAYNEFCAPSIPEAVGALLAEGVTHVTLITTMVTPGGVHAEVEIPEEVAELRARFPDASIVFAWPFDLEAVADLLASTAQRHGHVRAYRRKTRFSSRLGRRMRRQP